MVVGGRAEIKSTKPADINHYAKMIKCLRMSNDSRVIKTDFTVKRLEPASSCVRDQVATTMSPIHTSVKSYIYIRAKKKAVFFIDLLPLTHLSSINTQIGKMQHVGSDVLFASAIR